MDTAQLIDEGQRLIDDLDQQLHTLAAQLNKLGNLLSYRYSIERESPGEGQYLQGDQARAAIADDICRMDYSGRNDISPIDGDASKTFICACVQIPPHFLPMIDSINKTKLHFQHWHQRVLATQKTKAEKQEYLRKVILKKCRRPLLNLDACDAQLVSTAHAVTRVNWNINHCRPSRRLSVADAIAELKHKQTQCSDERRQQLDREITALQSLKPSTPVAACYAKGVKVLRFQARLLSSDGQWHKLAGHAAGPIFYCATHAPTPQFFPPSRQQRSRAGRPSTISDNCVSLSLPNWFFYRTCNTDSSTNKQPSAKTTTRKRSPIPGLRLGKRRGKVSVIAGNTSISIEKYGLEQAWSMGVDKLIANDKLQPKDRHKAIAMCPNDIKTKPITATE